MQKFKIKTEVCIGADALDRLSEIKAESAAIFTDAFMVKSGAADKIASLMPNCKKISVFGEIKPDPPIELIADGLKFLLDCNADVVVALGGGSSIDAAKSTILMAKRASGKHISLIAVPTTSGTGSEVTKFAVITDKAKGVKYPLVDDELLPDVAILSSELVKTAPPRITADTGFDVLTHALEAYISTLAHDISDALAEKSLELAFEYLYKAYKDGDDLVAREKMHIASCLAGMAFNEVSLGVNHGIAHALGANFHIPHGRANGMLLPYVIEYNADLDSKEASATAKKLAKLAKKLGISASFSPKGATIALVNELKRMQKQMEVPLTLAEAGVTSEQYSNTKEHIIQSALNDACTVTNPRKVTHSDVDGILSNLAKF